MITLPITFQEHARDGSDYIYVVDIIPRGSDAWARYRFADRGVTVDGNAYLGGYISNVDRIRRKADITRGGTIATRDPVNISLVNNKIDPITGQRVELHRQFQQNEIAGRDVTIKLAMMPLNLIRNSSFEAPTSGNNFDHWTETPGHASNSITRETVDKWHGAQSCKLTCVTASPAPVISPDVSIDIRRGTTVSLSLYAKGAAAADLLNVRIRVTDGANTFWWNDSTKAWQVGTSNKQFSLTTSFARYTIPGIYGTTAFTNELLTLDVFLEVPAAGDAAWIDGVQLEPRTIVSSYHGGRYDMTAADLVSLYVGECEAPRWNRSLVTIATKSVNNRRRKKIPVTLVSPETTDVDFEIPPGNLLKPFPMTYGDHFFDHFPANSIYPDGPMPAAGILVNSRALKEPIRVYFDRPGIALGTGLVYVFDENKMKFWREFIDTSASDYSEWQGSPTDAYRESRSDANYLRRMMVPISALAFAEDVNPNKYNYGLFTNPSNIADSDLATLGSITITTLVIRNLAVHMVNPSLIGQSELINAYAIAKASTVLNSGTATRSLKVAVINDVVSGSAIAEVTAGGLFDNIPTGLPTDAQEMDKPLSFSPGAREGSFWASPDTVLLLRCELIAGTSPNVTFNAYAIGMRIDFAIDLDDAPLFVSCLGRLGVLCKGHTTIKDIYQTEIGVPSGDINSTAFSAISIADMGCAGQLVEQRWSDDVIEEICATFGYVQFTDGAGKESIAALAHGATVKTMGKNHFVLNALEFGYTKREDIYSAYTLKYGHIAYADMFAAEIHCDRNSQDVGDSAYATKCDAAWDALGELDNPLNLETQWINDKLSAQTALKRKIDWNRGRKRTVKGQTDVRALDAEFGDRINLQLEDYLKERDTDVDRPVFMITSMQIDRANVSIELLEVLAP